MNFVKKNGCPQKDILAIFPYKRTLLKIVYSKEFYKKKNVLRKTYWPFFRIKNTYITLTSEKINLQNGQADG